MNEAIPDHYNIGPCRGKQFIDTESFLYWLEENHPWLLRILRFLGQVLLIIVLILGFIVLPVFGLIFFSYGFIFETELSEYYINDFVRFIGFLICFLLRPISATVKLVNFRKTPSMQQDISSQSLDRYCVGKGSFRKR